MLPPEPRTVKPRGDANYPRLPIVTVSRQDRLAFSEQTGRTYEWDEIFPMLRAHPPALVVTPNASWLVSELNDWHSPDDETWQYRLSPVKRTRYNPNPDVRQLQTLDVIVNYFGWRVNPKRKGKWHYPLDPALFSTVRVPDLIGHEGTQTQCLYAWGQDIRDWCQLHDLVPSPTAGGIGGQLLRDRRFFPAPRRKVPGATNERARGVLPGNHYRLYWPERVPVNVGYLDMSAAHHHAAATIQFPCPNGLFARGRFRHTTDTTDTTVPSTPPWVSYRSPTFPKLLDSHGLLLLRLTVPTIKPDRFPPPYLERAGQRLAWVFTNELDLLRSFHGVTIDGIDAAWTSFHTSDGLNRFAHWALAETALMNLTRKRWCKAALLATYGNLAATPRITERAYRRGVGEYHEYPAGPAILPAFRTVTRGEQETGTVNVIQRGMIEAETRKSLLNMARELTDQGHRVIALYADAVMVKDGTPLPLLPPPWRLDAFLTRVRFYAPTAFESQEMTKLPGIARSDPDRIASVRLRANIRSATIANRPAIR